MPNSSKAPKIIVCDDNLYARRLVADVLAGAGLDNCGYAHDGLSLLRVTEEMQPSIIVTSSRIPGVSGLEFTRKVRAGHGNIKRNLSIIVMTSSPTTKFLEASRDAGVDEMLVRPFSGAALLARVQAVMLRPRRLIESANYVGPCRRRRMIEDFGGTLRRFTDPLAEMGGELWEAETNRELVRECITKVSALSRDLTPGDRQKLREAYQAVSDTEQMADDMRDKAMGDAARSLSRYIAGMGASAPVDPDVFRTHLDAMQQLAHLDSTQTQVREKLVTGLVAVVDKRLLKKVA
jgi:DNA-binding response OmpR family regulator